MANVLEMMAYVTDQGDKGRERGMQNAFRRDSMAAMQGDPDAFMRQAAIDPASAKQVQDLGGVLAKRTRGAAKFMLQELESGDPGRIQGAWNTVGPYMAKTTGKAAPPQWDPSYQQGLQQFLAQTEFLEKGEGGNNVQSRFVAEDGRVMMVMRDGSVVDSGQKADRQMWFRDHPGMAPELVGKSGEVIPVGQQAPQAAPMPQPAAPVQTQFTGSDGAPVNIDPSLPPQVQAAIRANEGQWAQAPSGATATITGPQGQPPPVASGYTPGAARPAMTPAQMAADRRAEEAAAREAERLRLAREADARAARGTPPSGYRWNAEGTALEPIPGAPNTSKISAAEQKEAAARRAKVPQLQNAIRGLDRIEDALAGLNMPGINTGPLDQYAVRQLPSGQELEAAVGGIQNSFLALTRVPGIGSQSDLEARIAALQYPSLDKAPEVNARTMQNLRAFARDLAQAYQVAVETDAASGAYNAQPEAPAGNTARPQTEADYNALPSGALYIDPDDGRTYRKP